MSAPTGATAGSELERWNTRFSAEGYVFGTGPNAFLESQRHRFKPGMRVLSVADGEGRNGVWLARQGMRVTSFDFSPVGIEKSRKLAGQSGVQIEMHCSDIRDWDWDGAQYDAVVVIFCQFLAPAERARAFAGMMRALVPGGLLVMQGYRPEQLKYKTGGPKQVEQLYTDGLLRESFAALDILHLASHDDEVDEGEGHRGMSALIDLVARRPLA